MTLLTSQNRGAKPRTRHAAAKSILLRGPKNNAGFGEIMIEFEAFKFAHNAYHTVESLRGHLRKFGGWLDSKSLGLRDVRDAHLDQYILHRLNVDGVGDVCVRRDVIYIKALMKFAQRRDYIYRDPVADYQLPKADKPHRKMPSPDELRRILGAVEILKSPDANTCLRHRGDEASSDFYTTRDQAIIVMGIATGARISEIFSWTCDNYDPINCQIVIPRSKGGEPRYVAFEPMAKPYIEAYIKARPSDNVLEQSDWYVEQLEMGNEPKPRLFVGEGGQPLLQNCWGRAFKRYCLAARVTDITFHNLRHFNLSNIADISVKAAQAQGGHKSLKTAEAYQHKNANAQRQALLDAAPLGQVLTVGKPKGRQSLVKRS
jgi:integrase